MDASRWAWVEAHCTEGPLDLAARGFTQELRVNIDGGSLLLSYDQTMEPGCARTVLQRATPTADPTEWQMTEEVRVALPTGDECFGRMEDPRPGEVRRAGEFLEVLVQRSQWCNGLEVRMVYAPQPITPLQPEQVARRYIAHWNRRDAVAIAKLFADAGSMVEPFTVSDTGGVTRHDGRESIARWHAESFSGLPWIAVQLDELTPGAAPGQVIARWHYMDPRIDQPFGGRHQFTVAAGEIFEVDVATIDAPDLSARQQTAAQR